jgi:hypothetical protein
MKRNTTVVLLCILFIAADTILIGQTLATLGPSGSTALTLAMFGEVLAALLIAWIGVSLMRKKYRRQKKPVSGRERFAIAGH